MLKALLFVMLFCLAEVSKSAIDIPVEVRQNHLTFKGGGELVVSSDGRHFSLAKLLFRGRTYVLRGDVFNGLVQPDLSTVRLKLVADQCELERPCFEYSLPVAGIPEDQECLEECSVQFLLKGDHVYRKTLSRRSGVTTFHPGREFVVGTN